MPLQIYVAEAAHTLESLAELVNEQLKRDGRCIAVASEGFDAGPMGELHDTFGNVEYSSSQTTVVQKIVNYLNDNRLKARGVATAQNLGAVQRCLSLHASSGEVEEAYQVTRTAVEIAFAGGGGWMMTIRRKAAPSYRVFYDKVALKVVASSVLHLPMRWIAERGADVTDDFVRYALPLIGEGKPRTRIERRFQRFARLKRDFVEQKTPEYVPVKYRALTRPDSIPANLTNR